MKKLFLALMFGTILLPTESFADDRRGRDSYGWSSRYERREVQSSDPGYYCHRHERKIHKDDVRRHCHSAYSDEHGLYADRRRPAPLVTRCNEHSKRSNTSILTFMRYGPDDGP